MRCLWCGGTLDIRKELPHVQKTGWYCLMCARSDDFEYEANLRELRDKEIAGLIEYHDFNPYGERPVLRFPWLNR